MNTALLVAALLTHHVVVFDSFDRADNAASLGAANTGQVWTALGSSGVWGTVGNQAAVITPSAGIDRIGVQSGRSTNIAVQVKLAVSSGDQRICFRYSDASNEWQVVRTTTAYQLSKRVAGAVTQVGSFSVTTAHSDVIRVELVDALINVKLNGAVIITVTDAHNQNATIHGMTASGSNTTCRFDNFTIETI